jgi:hypothetical protein
MGLIVCWTIGVGFAFPAIVGSDGASPSRDVRSSIG